MKIEEQGIDLIRENHVIQIFVFRGEEYLGWDCFHKVSIAIGRSSKADLVLDDENIAAFQAIVFLDGGKIGVDLFENKTNRKSTVWPGPFDSIDIGPYALKIKLKGTHQIKNNKKEFHGRKEEPAQIPEVASKQIKEENPTKIQEERPAQDKIESTRQYDVHLKENDDILPKKDHDASSDAISLKSPVIEEAATENDKSLFDDIETNVDENDSKAENSNVKEKVHAETVTAQAADFFDWEDGDEDDDDDVEAFFSLKDKFLEQSDSTTGNQPTSSHEMIIEVIKSKYDKVCDVSFLGDTQKYIIENNRRFCLAENKRDKGQFVYFQRHHKGRIHLDKSTQKSIETLFTPEHIFHKRKRIYRYQLPKNSIAVIHDGPFEYRLKSVQAGVSPHVQETIKNNNVFFKHLVKSSVLHLFFLVFVGLFPGFTPPEKPLESRFVRIDTSEIASIQKKIHFKQPKTVSPSKKPTPKPVIDKRKPAVAKKTKKMTSKRRVASSHPKAGGGFGKGNIKNRNVNQTGILSMLGSSVGLQPGEAMAAVTNLDAISNTSNTRGNFKISGVTGKLGNGRIEMPTSDIVATKGSHQVLRSAGVGGKGRVAALKKGKTGQSKVMAMVTASLNKKVRIQGGMSREAVKRVIDMHMDEISHCYETALVDNPSIVGRVVFEWKILLSGKVGEIRIQNSSINSDYIHSCIQSRIKSWQFPKPTGSEVMVSYPFIFDIVGF